MDPEQMCRSATASPGGGQLTPCARIRHFSTWGDAGVAGTHRVTHKTTRDLVAARAVRPDRDLAVIPAIRRRRRAFGARPVTPSVSEGVGAEPSIGRGRASALVTELAGRSATSVTKASAYSAFRLTSIDSPECPGRDITALVTSASRQAEPRYFGPFEVPDNSAASTTRVHPSTPDETT